MQNADHIDGSTGQTQDLEIPTMIIGLFFLIAILFGGGAYLVSRKPDSPAWVKAIANGIVRLATTVLVALLIIFAITALLMIMGVKDGR